MADTAALAAVHAYADEAGAKLLLVGDPRQLGAVGAGGAMDLVAQSGARYDLADARRFHHEWERDASLRLRAGDPEVIKDYHRHGRLLDAGSLAEAEASAARAWLADTLAGHRSLLVVDTNDAAARVSSSIRDELVRLGRVAEHGLPLRDGTDRRRRRRRPGTAPRLGPRRLRGQPPRPGQPRALPRHRPSATTAPSKSPSSPPANRSIHRTSSTDGTTEAEGERLVLPPEYVAADLTLSYAGTVHAAEGATVWSAHPVVTPRTDLNALYVGLSRGREANTAHVATLTGPDDAAQGSETDAVHRDPRAVLATILDTREAVDEAHRSATTAQEDAAARAASVQTAGERFADVAHEAATERTARWLDALAAHDVLDPARPAAHRRRRRHRRADPPAAPGRDRRPRPRRGPARRHRRPPPRRRATGQRRHPRPHPRRAHLRTRRRLVVRLAPPRHRRRHPPLPRSARRGRRHPNPRARRAARRAAPGLGPPQPRPGSRRRCGP